jgi:hypothetical protein
MVWKSRKFVKKKSGSKLPQMKCYRVSLFPSPHKGFPPVLESFDVKFMEFRRQEYPDGVGPPLFRDFRKKIGEGTHENHVRSLDIAKLSRDLLPLTIQTFSLKYFLKVPSTSFGYSICPRLTAGGKIIH